MAKFLGWNRDFFGVAVLVIEWFELAGLMLLITGLAIFLMWAIVCLVPWSAMVERWRALPAPPPWRNEDVDTGRQCALDRLAAIHGWLDHCARRAILPHACCAWAAWQVRTEMKRLIARGDGSEGARSVTRVFLAVDAALAGLPKGWRIVADDIMGEMLHRTDQADFDHIEAIALVLDEARMVRRRLDPVCWQLPLSPLLDCGLEEVFFVGCSSRADGRCDQIFGPFRASGDALTRAVEERDQRAWGCVELRLGGAETAARLGFATGWTLLRMSRFDDRTKEELGAAMFRRQAQLPLYGGVRTRVSRR